MSLTWIVRLRRTKCSTTGRCGALLLFPFCWFHSSDVAILLPLLFPLVVAVTSIIVCVITAALEPTTEPTDHLGDKAGPVPST